MNMEHVKAFAQIPQPSRETYGFLEELRQPLTYHFREGRGCPAGATADCMKNGVEICLEYPQNEAFPSTAFVSLRRLLAAKGIKEKKGAYPLRFSRNATFSHEEYEVRATLDGVTVFAADSDGLRRAVYFLEDRIGEAEGPSVTEGFWHRKPFIRHRISRCFFGPTNRPPFFIDELTNDVDYYPEEYLNKLAHEGINGLWLTMYFRDLPSSVFPGRGKDAEKRFAKLRRIAERCGRYGIRIYIFLSEPKLFGKSSYSIPFTDNPDHPELIGAMMDGYGFFCTSTDAGKRYLVESITQIFTAVPKLGGVINIMLGEDNGSCVAIQNKLEFPNGGLCPVCSKRDSAEMFCELAELFTKAIKAVNPDAEYIGWFYAGSQRDGSAFMKRLLHVSDHWYSDATLMFNFESGGTSRQLDKKRIVFDYSLAYIGPSALFEESAKKVHLSGAKIQVGCSHENASVPFIPVPENLYDKYKIMHSLGVSSIMQCWYFGNYPGLMNKTAGELSFEPFMQNSREFLLALARPDWGRHAEKVADAWSYFSQGYRHFPSNLCFAWYGPLHQCIAWPLHLFPVDQPITPSWLLNHFPDVSGDRIGECIGYHHTLPEVLELCREMSNTWQKGVALLENLRIEFSDSPARLADIDLAKAIGIQMKSAYHILRFYFLREDMLFLRNDHLAEMKSLVLDEIDNTHAMNELCGRDSRLGYHSEAEGYLFFPEKLAARILLLQELLEEDFPKFDLHAPWIDEYTGHNPQGPAATLHRQGTGRIETYPMTQNASWSGSYDENNLYLTIRNVKDSAFSVILEPCRLWTPFRIDFRNTGAGILRVNVFATPPDFSYEWSGADLNLRIPRAAFQGFWRPGFPMKFNIYGKNFHWTEPKCLKSRLQHGDYNPAAAGWLVLD